MSARTRFLSRLIGLYCILISLSMVTHKQATVEAVSLLVQNAPLMFLVGVIVLAVGLAMILGHNVWSGGALPVVVTLVGWVSFGKGLLILFLSPQAAPGFLLEAMHYEQFFYLYACISLFLGVYLIYGASRISPGQA
jgi:hypothetical protein